jgi:arabinose-5-phosphate isomerase
VTVWARAGVPSKAISASHGKAARKTFTRLLRPLAGPAITMKILQRIHTLADQVPGQRETGPKTSLMELKQLWLMSRCDAPLASHRKNGRAKERPAANVTFPAFREPCMSKSNPLMAKSSGTDANAAVQSALRTLEAGGSGITALAAALQGPLGPAFADAVETIRQANGRVIVTGLGKSGHVARKIAATLASTGTPAFFVHAAEAGHGDLGMITPDDVIIALSWSGEQPEMKNLVNYSSRFAIPMIAVTSNAESSLGEAARIVLELPKAREACPHNLAPTTSSLMQAAIGDAIAIALLEGRGFTALEFASFHPGGKLGALLKFVRDIMHTGEAIPIKPLGARMSDALVEMSTKGFGCVCIVDHAGEIAGIITDGDLRRHMRPDLMTALVDDVMTRNPRTIPPGMLASEMLETLNSAKPAVTVLIVAEGKKPVGIVHVHDVLRAGVA